MIPGLSLSARRGEVLLFTPVFETMPAHIFFRDSASGFERITDLDGRRVALLGSGLVSETFASEPGFTPHLTTTLPEALFDVLTGNCDALIAPAPLVEYAARAANMEDRLGKSRRPVMELGRAIAVRPDLPEVRARLAEALEHYRDSEPFRELYRQWHEQKRDMLFGPATLWFLGALAAVVVAGLLAWRYVSLLRMNRRLTAVLSERDQAVAALRLTQERMEALSTMSQMDAAGTGELVRFALEEGVRLTGSKVGYIFFTRGDHVDLSGFLWSTGVEGLCSLPREGAYPLEQAGLWADCIRTRVPSVANDYAAAPGRRGLPEGHVPLSRHMAVPLISGEEVAAVLGVGNKHAPYDGNDVRQLQLLLSGLGRVLDARRDAEAIRQARDYAENLIQGANAMIIGLDQLGRVTLFNNAAEAVSGFRREEVLGREIWESIVPASRAEDSRKRYLDFIAGRSALPRQLESTVSTKSGSLRKIAWQNSLQRDGDAVTGIISFGMDVTEARAAETELSRLHLAIEKAAEGVLITDEAGRVIYANQALERMAGIAREELIGSGRSVFELDAGMLGHQTSSIRGSEAEGGWTGSCTLGGEGRAPAELEFTVTAIREKGDERACFVAVCRDVTDKRALEHQLWQAQKMEALGTLAGGVAHDFNNILASIMGFTELALDDVPAQSRSRACLDRVLAASMRARDLVRQILSFSRRGEQKKRLLEADLVVGEALKLLEASLPKEIDLVPELLAGPATVLADPSQLHQIVMNLCTNAAQAMRDTGGGRITVRTVAGLMSPEQAARHRLPSGDYFCLAVEDQGPGIPPDLLGRVFDPFFTTKDPGEGTGLGLSVVHGIATSLGGAVLAESDPATPGARFVVFLPTQQARAEAAPERNAPVAGGQGRVLVVDDEPDLLDLSRQALEPLGYQVSTMDDPTAALSVLTARPAAVDVLVTDQSMPRLTGLQLAEGLRKLNSRLPIVIMTGYSKAVPQDRLDALGAVRLLPKPFSTGELALAVGQALAARQEGTP